MQNLTALASAVPELRLVTLSGDHQNLNGSRDLITPFYGMLCCGLATGGGSYDKPIYQI